MNRRKNIVAVVVVLLALAAVVLIVCLSNLFNRLPIEIQQEIMNETNHSDFETQIERFSDAFVDFRYIYEDIFKTKDLNLKFWEDFSSAIYKIVPTHIAQKRGSAIYRSFHKVKEHLDHLILYE